MSTGRSEGLERRCFAIAGVSFAALAAYGVGAARAQDCESLVGKAYGDATVSAATNVTPPFSVTGKDPPTPVSVDAPFCRVEGTIKPSANSDIEFEVWLPPEGSWNGKYQGVGNGGFAGSLIYAPMSWALRPATPCPEPTPAIPAGRWTRTGRSVIRRRSSTLAGARSISPPWRPRRSSPTITGLRRGTPISAAALTAAARR